MLEPVVVAGSKSPTIDLPLHPGIGLVVYQLDCSGLAVVGSRGVSLRSSCMCSNSNRAVKMTDLIGTVAVVAGVAGVAVLVVGSVAAVVQAAHVASVYAA